jgi:uncharacterized repeat protein (TIGR01451 family)
MSMRGCSFVVSVLFLFSASWVRASSSNFSSHDYPVGHAPILAVAHDFNGDGKIDLAILNNGSGTVSVLLGNGDGTFQPAKSFDVGGANPFSLSVADLNGDGKLDLIIGGISLGGQPPCGASAVNILLGNGDGTFQTVRQAVAVGVNTSRAVVGDLNGDGKADIVVSKLPLNDLCTDSGYGVYIGNGDGTFQPEKAVTGGTLDLNGDGIPDIATIDGGGNGLNIYLGQSDGSYEAFNAGPESNAGLLSLADFNGDQKQDTASPFFIHCKILDCVGGTSYVAISLGVGDGTFRKPSLYPPAGIPTPHAIFQVGTGDFNGDGKADVAFIQGGSPGAVILLGKGDGTFNTSLQVDTGSGPASFIVADLNGDRLPDLILVNVNDDTISVALNMNPTSGADLSVQAGASPDPVSVTQNLTYSIQVINSGPSDSTDTVLKDTLPSGMSFTSAETTLGSCTQASLVVTCAIGKIVSGDSANVTIVVVPSVTGSATNAATVSGSQPDLVSSNNTITQSVRVDPMFNLKVTTSGAGAGKVALNGKDCGTGCTNSYPTGSTINLQATAAPGAVFGGWSGPCSSNAVNPSCNLTMQSDQTTNLVFDVGPNFFLMDDSAVLTVTWGSSATTTVSVLPEGVSFDGIITFACTVAGPATVPTCSFSPQSVTPHANRADSTLTILAPAQSMAMSHHFPIPSNALSRLLPLLVVLFALFWLTLVAWQSCAARKLGWFLAVSLLVVTSLLSACGSGNAGGPPPPGRNYNVMVTATSGSIQRSIQLSVKVQ